MLYRIKVRGYDARRIEDIVRRSSERYADTESGRTVIIGRHDERLVMIPIEGGNKEIEPVTVHATTRQQIRFRLQSGRFQI